MLRKTATKSKQNALDKWFRLSVIMGLTGVASVAYLSCTHAPMRREVAGLTLAPSAELEQEVRAEAALPDSKGRAGNGHYHVTPGLTDQEKMDLWHLSEGSDVFPLAWMRVMKSQFSHYPGTILTEKLDAKFNVTPDFFGSRSPYPLKWIGLTAAWSGAPPMQSDVKVSPGAGVSDVELYRTFNGTKSIAMVGVNCSFCHSSSIASLKDGHMRFFEGAPGMINIRGFFQDLFASTAKTMLTPDLLKEFLDNFNVPNSAQVAKDFVTSFKKELHIDTPEQQMVGNAISFLDAKIYADKKEQILRQAFFDRKPVVIKYLNRLLQLTFGFDTIPYELQARMAYIAGSIGMDPDLPVTAEGFSRTDAFGRISNLVARTKNPIPLTATTSVPAMWRIEYRAQFHWNANTNSIVMRNIGQSFGLGAVLTNPNNQDIKGQGLDAFDSTSNIYNLIRLENLVYKIATPQWHEIDGEVDLPRAVNGCNTYYKTCVKCHGADQVRIGPSQELINSKYIHQNVVNTDRTYNLNQATPVDGVAFKDALFGFTRQVRNKYYQKNGIPLQTQIEWQRGNMRGEETFRDTVLGQDGSPASASYMDIPADPTPGYPARTLAGIWATSPFLHNGSVPDIYSLLLPSYLRPKIFFVGDRNVDPNLLGYRSDFESLPQIENLEAKAQAILKGDRNLMKRLLKKMLHVNTPKPANILEAKIQVACTEYPERCFNTAEPGNSNVGHEGPMFGTNLSDTEKEDLIEFLKVLRPEAEYTVAAPVYYTWDGTSCHQAQ